MIRETSGEMNVNSVEIQQIDLRYERYRLRDRARESALLASILENGITEPLRGILPKDRGGEVILLDGFKRLRCGKKAGFRTFSFQTLAEDEAMGIIQLLRVANAKSLSLLEQALWVEELRSVHRLGTQEIAHKLEKSTAWVAVRLGIFTEMPESIREKIFSGQFPAYSYIYTLRQIRRLRPIPRTEIEEFVGLTASKDLSTREIDLLARGFFQGGEAIREQIRTGALQVSLQELKGLGKPTQSSPEQSHMNEFECRLIRDLEIVQKYLARVSRLVTDPRLTVSVHAEGNLLCGGILRVLPGFTTAIRGFYDRSRPA